MIQQVNLYRPVPQVGLTLDPGMMLRAVAALAFALAATTAYLALARSWSASAAGRLEARLGERQAELARLARVIESELSPGRVQDRAQALESERAAKQAVLAELDAGTIGRTQGFSRELRALSAGRVEGVWLTRFAFLEGGSQLVLAGRALRADDVPRLFERLGQSDALAGTEFREFRLTRERTAAPLDFEARTRAGEAEEKPS
jgi:Tfp pilus assembly protein PilN